MRAPWALWWVALAALLIPYLDSLWLTLSRPGRRYLRQATGARVLLGLIEVALLGGAVFLQVRMGDRVALRHPPSFFLAVTGSLCALAGALLAAWAKIRLGRLFTAQLAVKEDHRLIQDGPYAWIRHPIYLGILLFVLGSGLVWNSIPGVGLALGLIPCFQAQWRVEERVFAEHFGAEFEQYRRRVPAIWPRPRVRLPKRTSRP